ncbi:hypothetical protein PIB30_057326 [Stylosanthes scabra]|uniref:Uncharacterized protein n=1 Tax=Stylosanthes scabra TaxID=79078 RepID=A0ABU6SJW2_9FABA|nr:hypothetical protein [Stylosanthes scabra]
MKREDLVSISIQTRSKAHQIIKRTLASSGDPYTRFLSPEETESTWNHIGWPCLFCGCETDVEALKEQLREELRLMEEHRRQMGVTGEHMRAGSSSTAQVPPLHPPAPPKDDDADYVDP